MHGLNPFWTKKWNSSRLIRSSQKFSVLMAMTLSNENFLIMWRYSLLDDFVPHVSQQLLCSCTRVPANRIRDPLNIMPTR